MATKRKSLGVTYERYLKTERTAIELSDKIKKRVNWSDLVNHLIDNYMKEAEADFIATHKKTKNN